MTKLLKIKSKKQKMWLIWYDSYQIDHSLWVIVQFDFLWNKVQLDYFDTEFHFNPSALKRNVLVWILTTICFPFATFWFRYYLPWSFHIVPRPSSSILMTLTIVHFSLMNNNAVIQSQKQNLKLIFDWLLWPIFTFSS